MKRKKILQKIGRWLDKDRKKQRHHRDELQELLEKLRDKESKLEQKLESETNDRKHKLLATELKIVKVQLDKGSKALDELAAS